MPQKAWPVIVVALAVAVWVLSERAQSDDDRTTIMHPEQPEPWLPPKYQAPRGSSKHLAIPSPAPPPQPRAGVPPPLYVPQTGRVLPNLPSVSGAAPNGTETYQDRALRCAHQAGVYGQAAGDHSSYIGSCINQ